MIPHRNEPSNLSRDFWMPDQSCRVCYECDSQFTVFNRRHHCRLCGRVFCAKCTANFIPAPSAEPDDVHDESKRIRVCNFCYNQGKALTFNGVPAESLCLSSSSNSRSLASTSSNCTTDSIGGSCEKPELCTAACTHHSSNADTVKNELIEMPHGSTDPNRSVFQVSLSQDDFFMNRSDGEGDEYDDYHSDYALSYSQGNDYYGALNHDEINYLYGLHEAYADGETTAPEILSCLAPTQEIEVPNTERTDKTREEANGCNVQIEGKLPCEESFESEAVDYENNGLLWLPPEPENEEDERETALLDDEGGDEGSRGEWGYLRSSDSFGNNSSEEHRRAMKNVVEGHFTALVSQLLEVENLPKVNESDNEGWLDIITSLSWEAATLLKPDTSKGGGMDPGGYVKIKCIPCGHRRESMVVRGVVCKKNVAHRRMTTKIEKPRLLILGGALEYQRISNQLSSFDTLLQQEMDHLKMAVAKIDSHNPDILLVEKSVTRYAQDYLLAKDISLVLNIKRPLLERIARCTGAHIVPSIDHLTSPKLGHCDMFRVDKFAEEHVSTGQGVKKMVKNLMFFEGCPKPLGFTILLKGAPEDELKKVKHVIQYGVFAAYHLALETSFLADEGASLPELPLKTPITVALPDKPSMINRSISTIPGFAVPSPGDDQISPSGSLLYSLDALPCKPSEQFSSKDNVLAPTLKWNQLSSAMEEAVEQKASWSSNVSEQVISVAHCSETGLIEDQNCNENREMDSSKEDYIPSNSNDQSILVSLSTRCVWKGSVCNRAHVLRIKYYGSFDKPLGRFLHDNLFDQDHNCSSCDMPSEAHIHCYTHRHGSLTISVKKLPECLPGEREGKIWMWHRCLKCPRVNGCPPATRRIVMSDAAWGLSFGKFLELSFSNHAAASRVANCGHSLHRDCLRFYGFGRMVACFRYASIKIHSVYLPPPKVEFNYDNQEWIQNEAKEVIKKAEVLSTEIQEALRQIEEKAIGAGSNEYSTGKAKLPLADLQGILEKRKNEIKESVLQILKGELKAGKPIVDILEINKLRRLILFYSYAWDEWLRDIVNLIRDKNSEALSDFTTKFMGRVLSLEKLMDSNMATKTSRDINSHELFLQETKPNSSHTGGVYDDISLNGKCEVDSNRGDLETSVDAKQVVRRASSKASQLPMASNLSDTLDAAWTGKFTGSENGISSVPGATVSENCIPNLDSSLLDSESKQNLKGEAAKVEDSVRADMSSPKICSLDHNYSFNSWKQVIAEHHQTSYVSSYRELELNSGARLLLPLGVYDTVVPVYDDEPTSVISYALASLEYFVQMSEAVKPRERSDSVGSFSLLDSMSLFSLNSLSDLSIDMSRSLGSAEEQVSQLLDSSLYMKDLHTRVSFTDEGPPGKVKYTVTCYYAKGFETLRRKCGASELDFIRSLGRCKKWGAQGGKSNVFFAKTLDDRFIIKQVTKTELESFIKFGPAYFKYLSDSINSKCPTCLAKILGIYQVSCKHLKGGKEFRMDVLVMENLLFKRDITRLYDLKGSSRSRYNSDTSGVLLDQNLIEAMPTSPIFVGSKAKRLLERAVWNDTSFLASINVMDYSLLVGVDEKKSELVLGIIDFMRQYTWDKHLETWVKTSGLLGGAKNTTPTVISPQQYKKRFRKAMTAYFVMVPEQWPSSMASVPNSSQAESKEEKDLPQAYTS